MRSENVYAVNWIKGVKTSKLPRMRSQMWVVGCLSEPGLGKKHSVRLLGLACRGSAWLGFDSAEGCAMRRALHLFHAPLHCEMCQIKRSKPQGWTDKATRGELTARAEGRTMLTHMPDRLVLANFAPCLLFALRVVFIQLRVENFVIPFSFFK